VRFGIFDVDLRTGELRKGGAKIKLHGQPFNVLAIPLERPGQVVTREELQQTLWAGDTFVDFEQGLNKAINRVREALGDDANNPRFVETLPRRGYRFIAPLENTSPTTAQPPRDELPVRPSWRQRLLWSAVSLAVAALAGAGVWYLQPSPAIAKPVIRFTITLPSGQHLAGLDHRALALSPDGTKLAYVAATRGGVQEIYVRAMDTDEVSAIGGTVGAANPFFSPDGQWLGFVTLGKLKKIPVNGGSAQTLADGGTFLGATWGSYHTIVFSPLASVLQRVSDGGGPAQPVTRFNPGESLHLWPEFLPGSEAVVFEALYPPKIVIQRLAGSERQDLNQSIGSNPHYASSGHLIYALGDNLMALPFDLDRLRVRGTAVPVMRGVLVPGTGGAQYDVSATGSLVYIAGSVHSAVNQADGRST